MPTGIQAAVWNWSRRRSRLGDEPPLVSWLISVPSPSPGQPPPGFVSCEEHTPSPPLPELVSTVTPLGTGVSANVPVVMYDWAVAVTVCCGGLGLLDSQSTEAQVPLIEPLQVNTLSPVTHTS